MTQHARRSQSQDADTSIAQDAEPLQEQFKRQDEEIAELHATIRSLQMEIRALRGSLSWTVTRPLRALARSLPGVAASVQRILDRTNDVLVTRLPRQSAQAFVDNR